jgi:hypothetical protein
VNPSCAVMKLMLAYGYLGNSATVALPERAHRIAIPPVPLRPVHGKVAHLVAAGAEIPRLGNQLELADGGVLVNDVEKGAQSIDFVQLTRKRAGEVESEAVDVHLEHPVPQAVHDELQHLRALHVQRVAAAGEVQIIPSVVVDEPIVGGIIDAPQRQGRSKVIAFSGVVVDDIEDHFYVCAVERLDHLLEFPRGLCRFA